MLFNSTLNGLASSSNRKDKNMRENDRVHVKGFIWQTGVILHFYGICAYVLFDGGYSSHVHIKDLVKEN